MRNGNTKNSTREQFRKKRWVSDYFLWSDFVKAFQKLCVSTKSCYDIYNFKNFNTLTLNINTEEINIAVANIMTIFYCLFSKTHLMNYHGNDVKMLNK